MAVVFISPKQRQKVFFIGITAVFLLFWVAFSLMVFLSKPIVPQQDLVFNKPKVNVNLAALDSDQFKKLKPFVEMEMQFAYTGFTEDNKKVSGVLSATSKDQAYSILQGMKVSVSELKEVMAGRDNPFAPYFNPLPQEKPATTKKTSTKTK